ncbi:MAG: hypothetical protein NTY38_24165 [Acidobacteria bacterium]|nr:hypothetical protein [Acidobacteriota bacterium]
MRLGSLFDQHLSQMRQLIPDPGLQVCFVRKMQSGFELARKLGVSIEVLRRHNPQILTFDDVIGTELLLVPGRALGGRQVNRRMAAGRPTVPGIRLGWPGRQSQRRQARAH